MGATLLLSLVVLTLAPGCTQQQQQQQQPDPQYTNTLRQLYTPAIEWVPLEREGVSVLDSNQHTNKPRYKRQSSGESSIPPPRSVKATPTSPSEVKLQWQYDNVEGPLFFMVRVYDDGGSLVQDRETRDTTVTLINLEPAAQLTIKVSAFKLLPRGRRAFSSEVEVVVETPDVMLPTPQNLRVTGVSTTSINLQWQHSGNRQDEFLIRVLRGGSLLQERNTGRTSITITDLEPNTSYTVTVLTFRPLPRGRRAKSPETNPLPVTTKGLHLSPPKDLHVGSSTGDSISLKWQYDDADGGLFFMIRLYTAEGSLVYDQETQLTTTTLYGLDPASQYTVSVSAFKPQPGGHRAFSPEATLPIGPSVPHSPPTLPPRITAPPRTTVPPTRQSLPVQPPPVVDGVPGCSVYAAPGVSIEVLYCGLGLLIRRNGACNMEGGHAPLETVVLADCWGVATVVARCQGDGLWHPYNDNGGTDTPPTLQLCQYHNINSPVCGRRASWKRQSFIQTGRQPHWPWLAALYFLETFICTATIISHSHVLTAAHCLTTTTEDSSGSVDLRNLRVQHLGEDGRIRGPEFVSQVDLWPEFVGNSRPSGDLALIRLERNLTFSRHLQPACLSMDSHSYNSLAATFERKSTLHAWDIVVQRHDSRCASTQDVCARSLQLARNQFCGIDTATQDKRFLSEGSSGGPYLVNSGSDSLERWEVSGLVSSSHTHTRCPSPLTIFTHVPPYNQWIFKCVYFGRCEL